MNEFGQKAPLTLNYSTPPNRQRTGAAIFWTVYLVCALVGLLLLEPLLANFVFGHPGDEGVAFLKLTSAAVVTAITAGLDGYLRRRPPGVALVAAAVIGLGAFVPVYIVMFLFS